MTLQQYFSKLERNPKPEIFFGDYTERLIFWRQFRDHLENSSNPIKDVLQLYKLCPLTYTKTNFFDRSTWPQAWNLIEKNDYNSVDRLLGMWYTLRLTDKFVRSNIDLLLCVEKNSNHADKKHTTVVLAVDNQYCDVENSAILSKKEFDNQYISQYTYFNL
jgi:hypothetical protein